MEIHSATGNGNYGAMVGADNRLRVRGVEQSEALDANKEGDAYNINTGLITVTNTTEIPLLYFKNNEAKDFIIEAVVLGIYTSANQSASDAMATFIRNPTTGTIVDNAVDVSINSNRNYGSSNSLTADTYKGAMADTMTDGDDHILVRVTDDSRNFIAINEVLPKGTSFGLKFTPPTGNTSVVCYAAIIGYIQQ